MAAGVENDKVVLNALVDDEDPDWPTGGGVQRGTQRRGRGLEGGSEAAALLLASSSAETNK